MERTGDVQRGSPQSVPAEQRSLVGLSEAAERMSVGLERRLVRVWVIVRLRLHRGGEASGSSDATSARRCRTDGERSAPCTTIGGARVMCDRLCGEAAPQGPVPDADGGPGIPATDLPGRERREGKRIAIEEERESRPDVKPRAAGAKRRNVMLG
ncbi:hypothetical protein NQZ68_019362 [Dissostichus eleginoides]|nr:hypothetical protein NQZ68_019362 [Dissostichus eleginoides]